MAHAPALPSQHERTHHRDTEKPRYAETEAIKKLGAARCLGVAVVDVLGAHMLKVGLTGGLACGKSTVGRMFAELGAHLIKADDVAHRLMQPGEPVYEEVVRHFGRDILNPDHTIHRSRLAEAAFGGNRVIELNALVHPAVIAYQDEWVNEVGRADPNAIAMVEAALIFEAGCDTHFDRIVVVTCRPEQRIERFGRRQGLLQEAARAEAERRIRAQIPDGEKARRAHYVIDNSGAKEQTRAQVESVYQDFKQLASRQTH